MDSMPVADSPDPLEPLGSVTDLQQQNSELVSAMRRMAALQEQMLPLRSCQDLEQALDAMEILLEDLIDFTYLRLYLGTGKTESALQLARAMCPQEYTINWELVGWALAKQEPTFLPVGDQEEEGGDLKNRLILPLFGHTEQVGVLLLWVDFDMTDFTQERSALLTMLARETASVLESIRLRLRVEGARAELADVVENIPLGLVAVDREDTITLINGTAEFILRTRRQDAIGTPLGRFLPPKALAQLHSAMRGEEVLESGELELEMEFDGHETETFGINVSPLHGDMDVELLPGDGAEGGAAVVRGHVLVLRDLKLSREVAKLRELDSMKNDFLSLVSHELRTPLTSIMAYSETLLMEGMIDTEEERREYLEIIHSEGERLSRLINDVLDLTKMESGKMDYTYQEIDVEEVVRSGLAAVHSLAAKKSIEMPCQVEGELHPVKADRDKIIQVLANLYSNAIKFTDEGGTVGTVCRLVSKEEAQTPGPQVEVAVRDTGMGIAPEDIHKVFSKFEQIEKIDHHSVGTGLGMPIVKQIVEEGHAGSIWIESEVNVGTVVTFRLPVY